MIARSIPDLEKIWTRLEHAKKLSDGLISIGGVGVLGVNGVIAMVSAAFARSAVTAVAHAASLHAHILPRKLSSAASASSPRRTPRSVLSGEVRPAGVHELPRHLLGWPAGTFVARHLPQRCTAGHQGPATLTDGRARGKIRFQGWNHTSLSPLSWRLSGRLVAGISWSRPRHSYRRPGAPSVRSDHAR